jgi:heterodisulfide reductase subunit A
MAQLDKTFPTNDCSACIFSPKLQTLAQNPNIEILAYSRIEGIEGEAGNFRVKVRRKARYVDPDSVLLRDLCRKVSNQNPNEYNFGHDMRKAIYQGLCPGIRPYAQSTRKIQYFGKRNVVLQEDLSGRRGRLRTERRH